MSSAFWELFVRRITTGPQQRMSDELNRLAEEIARLLAGFDASTAAELLSSINERVAQRYDDMQKNGQVEPPRPLDPSDVGAPPGAPRPTPATPELIASVLRKFNEEEVAQELREIRSGGGRKLEDFIGELEDAARQSGILAPKKD